jgi:hypothetical protein
VFYRNRLVEVEELKSAQAKKEALEIPTYKWVKRDEKGRIYAESYEYQSGFEKRKLQKSEILRLSSEREGVISFLKKRVEDIEKIASEYIKNVDVSTPLNSPPRKTSIWTGISRCLSRARR